MGDEFAVGRMVGGLDAFDMQFPSRGERALDIASSARASRWPRMALASATAFVTSSEKGLILVVVSPGPLVLAMMGSRTGLVGMDHSLYPHP